MSLRITCVIPGFICLLGCSPSGQPRQQTAESPVEQSSKKIVSTKPEQGSRSIDSPNSFTENNLRFRGAAQALQRERIHLDRTVYRHEMEGQAYESSFISLWDRLRSTEPYMVLRQFPFVRLEYRLQTEWKTLPLGMQGIRETVLKGELISLDHHGYVTQLDQLKTSGWKIIQTEWHHSEFRPGKNSQPPQSIFSFEIHSANEGTQRRAIIKGKLEVTWTPHKTNSGMRIPGTIKVQDASITDYTGKPAFAELLKIDPKKVDERLYPRVSPLMVHDLNKDGLPEIVLAGCNLVYWNQGKGKFQHESMLKYPIMPLGEAGILSDFNGDGHVDFVSSGKEDGLLKLWVGSTGGRFPAKPSTCFQTRLLDPYAMTAGDIDNDGDLDLFVGQWKQPYLAGSMPTPYYDSRDGYPDFLLSNNGSGQFLDITESAGLGPNQNRRTLSASLADLDGDHDLDLLAVCDYAGIDLYRNNGQGQYQDMSNLWAKERHGFGMAHAINDFDGDGNLDIYMVGMSSTSVERLDKLELGRKGYEKIDAMRTPMTYGNRLLLWRNNRFQQPVYSDQAARTDWSWGCGAADFDNDGDIDLYVANGQLSGESALDYDPRFWCHDVYSGTSQPDRTLDTFYSVTLQGLGSSYSWAGFLHNHLFLNQNNNGFRNVAFLLGTAFEFDARAVVASDVNVDGKQDLLVVQYDARQRQQRLFVLLNQIESFGNWIGVHIPDLPRQPSNGAIVRLFSNGKEGVRQLVTGDSYTAQHPATAHFGLGAHETVEKLVIRWPSRKTVTLSQPKTGQYHRLKL